MGWSNGAGWNNWSYIGVSQKNSVDRDMLVFTNDLGYPCRIHSVSLLQLGTGNGTFKDGDQVVGTGKPYNCVVRVIDSTGQARQSNTQKITAVVNTSYTGHAAYTFTFDNSNYVYVKPGDTVTFTFTFSKINNQNFVIMAKGRNNNQYTGVTSPSGVVRIYKDGAWKMAQPYIYSDGAWKMAIPYTYDGSNWKINV